MGRVTRYLIVASLLLTASAAGRVASQDIGNNPHSIENSLELKLGRQYRIARPMNAESLETWLRASRDRPIGESAWAVAER